ncbi:MAG TPA: hypothetical protein VK718_09210 [Ferruginibacter sp.]|jgi:hypothetical protein|nr:hypothetical protein [Ferruginibacter sp.]
MYLFKVQGNNGVYEVVIDKQGDNLIATCTCANAQKGMICSHRRSIINGYDSNVIENKNQVKEIKEYVSDTKRILKADVFKKDITIASIKADKVKNDKIFFYERANDNSPWVRMEKLYFDYAVKENKEYALEIQYDKENGSVILMKYVKNSEQIWARYNINTTSTETIRSIETLKVTITKNGKPFFYQRSGDNGLWSRIDKSFYDYLVEHNKDYSLETKVDENGYINYLRYEYDAKRMLGDNDKKKNKGCLPIVLVIVLLFIFFKLFFTI